MKQQYYSVIRCLDLMLIHSIGNYSGILIRSQILFMVCFCFKQPVMAQQFKPGYVLLNNGDTLHGLIQTENWGKAPLKVQFKASATETLHTYSPLLIHSFRIKGGDWYFSYVGDIDPSSLNDDQLDYNPFPDTVRVAMFIRSVVMGKLSLYYARDYNDRVHLFIQKDGGATRELNYKKYYIEERVLADYRNQITRRTIMANQIYKEQLTNLMADCPAVAIGIVSQPLSYSKNDIMELVVEYNRCKSAKTSFVEKKEAWHFQVRAHAGINYARLQFKSATNTYIGGATMENALGYAFGLSLNAVLPRTGNSWSIFNELMLRDYNSTGVSGTAPFKEQRPVKMDLIYVKLGTMIRYQFTGSAAQPFLQAGITNSVALKTTNLETDSSGLTYNFLQYFRTYEQGLVFGTGIEYKSVTWDLLLEFSNAMSGYSDVKSGFTTWYVMMGYKF